MPLTRNGESDQGELVVTTPESRPSSVAEYAGDKSPTSFEVADIEWVDCGYSTFHGHVNKRFVFYISWDSMQSQNSAEKRRWILGNRLPNIKQMKFQELDEAKAAAKQVLIYFINKLLKQ